MANKDFVSGYVEKRVKKQINNLSRAINKIDPELRNKTFAVSHEIADIKVGINDITYMKDGFVKKVRYDAITSLSNQEQASLLNRLSTDRYELRQQRALEQLKETGKISRQFKRSVMDQNKKLYENILEMEDMMQGNRPEAIQNEFEDLDIMTGETWYQEADSFFQGDKGTPELFDFYRPGEAGGFSELNSFTWNAYKVMKGMV